MQFFEDASLSVPIIFTVAVTTVLIRREVKPEAKPAISANGQPLRGLRTQLHSRIRVS